MQAIDFLLEQDPVTATWLGDHRFDSQLPDMSVKAMARQTLVLEDFLTELELLTMSSWKILILWIWKS